MIHDPDRPGRHPRQLTGARRWIPEYGLRTFRADLLAGLTVAVLIVPQSMAYAHLAGVPPTYGLYASMIPLLVYPLLGTSLHLAVGVIAIDMLIVRSGLIGQADAGSATYLQLVVVLTLMVGVIQIGMGLARLGFLANLLSRPVMVGFTSGAALLIAFGQVTALTGMGMEGATVLPGMAWSAAQHAADFSLAPFILGISSLAVLLLLRWWKPVVPGALVVVVLGVLAVQALGPAASGVVLVGEVPSGLPPLLPPRPTTGALASLLPTALTLALVQFVTVISLGKVFAARFRYPLDQNRELLAVGAANVAGSFFRALPVSGSFGRTALNVQAGAHTPFANVVTALVVGLCLLFLTPVLALVPIPVLGGIIVFAALALLDLKEMRFLLRAKSVDGWIAVLTFVGTLVLGILQGILVGVAASVVAILYRMSHPNAAVLGHIPGTRSFRDVRFEPEAQPIDGVLLLRVDVSFGFINAEFLKDLILEKTAETGPELHSVILDASSVNDLDTTAVRILVEAKEILDRRGVGLYFTGVKEQVRRVLARTGATEAIGPDRFFLTPHRAVKALLAQRGEAEAYLRDVPGGTEAEADAPDHPLELPTSTG